VLFMTASNIPATHAFTTRIGGVSKGIYESLNLAQRADDGFDNVKENYSRLCCALGISTDDLVCSTQVHGTFIRKVTYEDCGELFKPNPHEADALITQTPGVALMVFVADCLPILLYDPVQRVAGAIHAGWRSTVANIAGLTIEKMKNEYGCSPADICAAIGPCISKCCFETDSDVIGALQEALGKDSESCYSKKSPNQKNQKFLVDLKETNHILLKSTGVTNIVISDECTSCLYDKYWSHRKTQGKRGSQAAVIVNSTEAINFT